MSVSSPRRGGRPGLWRSRLRRQTGRDYGAEVKGAGAVPALGPSCRQVWCRGKCAAPPPRLQKIRPPRTPFG
eukprot:8359219-Pyramimonas_sp.AAC.1